MSREQGDVVEDYVNEVLGTKSTVNSGSCDRHGNSTGYDHASPRFVGESKWKGKDKKPTITAAEFAKIKKKAEEEGYKDWFFVVFFNDGKDRTITLDLDVFAELTHHFWHHGKKEESS